MNRRKQSSRTGLPSVAELGDFHSIREQNVMMRDASYHQGVPAPFRGKVDRQLIATFKTDEGVGYGRKDFTDRMRRSRFPMPD